MTRRFRGIDDEPGWINRRFKDLQAQIDRLASAKRLPGSSVPGQVITITEILTNPTGTIQFTNTDTATCSADGAAIPIPLSHVPKDGSEQVFYSGIALKRADWTRTETLLTIPGEPWFRAGKRAWVNYSYDTTLAAIVPVITSPANNSSTTDSTPLVTGTGAPGYAIKVYIDGTTVGSATVQADGTWSLTSTTLSTGSHTGYAIQTSPDGTLAKSATVTFAVVSIPAAYGSVSSVTGDHTSIPLPSGTVAGDMLILVLSANNQVGCSDSRFNVKNTGTFPSVPGPTMGIWVGTADGSGAAVPVLMDSVAGSGGADSCGAIMRITGNPLLPATAEVPASGSGATYTPTTPGGGSFGVMAVASAVGLVASVISDDSLGHWTTRVRIGGNGSGKSSLWIGTINGAPATGQWNQSGSDPQYVSWAGGLQ